MARKRGEALQNPDYQGAWGRAWEVDGTARKVRAEQSATLGIWLIEAPEVNPLWIHYAANLFHLRDIPGAEPATITRPNATHEFLIGTIDPAVGDTVDPSDITTFKMLSPPDLQLQLILPSDERALEVGKLAIQGCLDGRLSPDAKDNSRDWARFFQSQEK